MNQFPFSTKHRFPFTGRSSQTVGVHCCINTITNHTDGSTYKLQPFTKACVQTIYHQLPYHITLPPPPLNPHSYPSPSTFQPPSTRQKIAGVRSTIFSILYRGKKKKKDKKKKTLSKPSSSFPPPSSWFRWKSPTMELAVHILIIARILLTQRGSYTQATTQGEGTTEV